MTVTFLSAIFLSVILASSAQDGSDGANQTTNESCKHSGVSCQSLNYTTCYGAKLLYGATSTDIADDVDTQEEAQRRLRLWSGLRSVPECWAVIQPLLCAVYVPKCVIDKVDLPSREMCENAHNACTIVELTHNRWPSFLQCENFPSHCQNEVSKFKFNATGQCSPPLLPTDSQRNWYASVEGCGVQCRNPLYTTRQHRQLHVFIAVMGSLCLACTLFAAFTFIVDWKNASRYPALGIFYINCCFALATVAWLAQFLPGARDNIVCRRDGTGRLGEPNGGENLSCLIVFVVIYYFLTAAVIWFVLLAYTWHVFFKMLRTSREVIEGKAAYFHMFSWSVPLVLTITILTLSEIDGDSLSGICFVGMSTWYMRTGFVLLPVMLMLCFGGYFLIRGVFIVCSFAFVLITFCCHIYEYSGRQLWNKNFRDFLVCQANTSGASRCAIVGPSIVAAYFNHVSVFGAGMLMSSWVWTASTVDAWKRFFCRLLKKPVNEPVRLTREKMIAKAFAKKKQVGNTRRMSISFHSTHDDPLGMNFEMREMSQEVSSNWVAAALPRLLKRRGAIIQHPPPRAIMHASSQSDLNDRNYSMDSQLSEIARRTRKRKKRKFRGRTQVSPWPVQMAFLKHQLRRHASESSLASHASMRLSGVNSNHGARGSNRTLDGAAKSNAHTSDQYDIFENPMLFQRKVRPDIGMTPIPTISSRVRQGRPRRCSASFSTEDIMMSTALASGNPHPTMDDIVIAYRSGYSSGINSRRSSFDGSRLMMMRLPGQLSDSEVERPPHLAQQSLNMPIFKREVGRSSRQSASASAATRSPAAMANFMLHNSSSS
ncbi:PREDICTED: smoothened homolog isoform X2 [Priapulus caudatus]|uniref:Smoothened homolog isoform X2 n=1 Tax=Priapulus caudatus TaxID=37621 RepID=A0ABM1E2B8_PRICU|nr:PREDICTED: smoothened homolog isoform X2 [Priapulus caudatus]